MINYPSKLHVEISIDVQSLPNSFKEWEQLILAEVNKAKLKLIQQAFETYEQGALDQPHFVLKDRRQKWFHTILGEIHYPRYRIYDRKEKRTRYPLDEWFSSSSEHADISDSLKDELVRLAVDVPYRFVAREVRHWTNNDLSKDTIWDVVQSIGEARWKEKDSERRFNRYEALPTREEIAGDRPPDEILCIGLDGTFVKSQENRKRLKKKHDVKVAVLYTGKERKHGDTKLTDRRTVTQATDESLNQFLGRVVAQAIQHYGLNQDTTVLLFGDGDSWIRRFQDFIPKAHYRLDPWHVMEKIREAFGLEDLPHEWVKLIYGNPDGLIAEIKQCALALSHDKTTKHDKIHALVQYIQNNRKGLLPWTVPEEIQKRHKELFTWGSGHVESQIELAVCDRHKQNRMSWSKKGLRNLSTLREDKLNGYQKQKYSCTTPPMPFRIKLGSLGVWPHYPQ